MQTKLIALTFILQAIAILSLAYAVYSQRKTIILLKERTFSLHLTQCAMQDTIKFISEWIKSEIRMQDLARSKEEYETSQKLKDLQDAK